METEKPPAICDGKPKDLIAEWLGHGDNNTMNKDSHVNLEGMKKILDKA